MLTMLFSVVIRGCAAPPENTFQRSESKARRPNGKTHSKMEDVVRQRPLRIPNNYYLAKVVNIVYERGL